MRRKKLAPLVFIVLTAAIALGACLVTDTSPQLGLDLQGGVAVVLQPTEEANDEALDQTIEIIRNRVDALGVAEPEIARQGDSIVVQLPGVDQQQRALDLVGATAELRFRPVLLQLPPEALDPATTTSGGDGSTTTTVAGVTSTTAPAETTTTAPVEGQSREATPFQDASTTTTTAAGGSTTTTVAGGSTTTTTVVGEPSGAIELTPRDEDLPEATVVLPELGDDDEIVAVYQLGPSQATGEIVATANAELDGNTGQWSVSLEMKGGEDGIDKFNAIAAQCFPPSETCPTGQLAIVLDSVVQSAPTIQTSGFEKDQIQISGSFTESEAKDLALALRYGSLPVTLEPQTVRTVSPTLGEDSLKAGLAAGFLGLALVCLYMLFYYRALGLVVVAGLCVWSALLYSIISYLGVALSLAGVTGIVVSVGVTVDSYVVYFERLKDEVKAGRTLRSSTERAFSRAFRTIVAADISSFLGAIVLYQLTVGPVRGFAFFLGLSTILDMIVAWFFTRPLVGALAQNRWFTEAPRFGVARGPRGARTPVGSSHGSGTMTEPMTEPTVEKRSIFTRLYHGETDFKFVEHLKRWAIVSSVIIIIGLLAMWQRGLNLGIDFEGGIVWEVPAGDVSVAEAQDALDDNGLSGVTIQTLTSADEVLLRVEAEPIDDPEKVQDVSRELAEITGSNIEDVSLNAVGPSWGEEISRKAIRALVVFLILITIYITLRFELRMAIPTLIALIHDVLITMGVYAIVGFEVTPATVIAVLTILGFSIYDGIVVFDKVDENTKLVGTTQGMTYTDMVDLSLNQVLMRSLNTSITALLPVASLLILGSFILGATTLQEFALALLIGLFAGAYSSIFIASPLLAVLKEREPRYREIRRRIEGKGTAPVKAKVVASSKASDGEGDGDGEGAGAGVTSPTLSGRPIPPRPRKKGKKR